MRTITGGKRETEKKIANLLVRYGLEFPDEKSSSDVASETDKIERTQPTIFPVVTNCSPSEEKIALFVSLFRGREDVYAKRWHSEKSGKSGYRPVCLNE